MSIQSFTGSLEEAHAPFRAAYIQHFAGRFFVCSGCQVALQFGPVPNGLLSHVLSCPNCPARYMVLWSEPEGLAFSYARLAGLGTPANFLAPDIPLAEGLAQMDDYMGRRLNLEEVLARLEVNTPHAPE